MRPIFFFSSLSLLINIVPHKLKVLNGNVVNAIYIILDGGLGLPLYIYDDFPLQSFQLFIENPVGMSMRGYIYSSAAGREAPILPT